MSQVPFRVRYHVAVIGPYLVCSLHQERTIFGNLISRSTRHLPHFSSMYPLAVRRRYLDQAEVSLLSACSGKDCGIFQKGCKCSKC